MNKKNKTKRYFNKVADSSKIITDRKLLKYPPGLHLGVPGKGKSFTISDKR